MLGNLLFGYRKPIEISTDVISSGPVHEHKIVDALKSFGPWRECVDPRNCQTPAAHHDVVLTYRCRCGAYRQTEMAVTGGKKYVTDGPWRAALPDDEPT